jgi:hypothetical protein
MRFIARLEAADGSGHFRRMTVYSPSEDEAQRFITRTELQKTMFRLSVEQLEQLQADYKLSDAELADLVERVVSLDRRRASGA